MEVLEGRMIFYLDGKELVTSTGDPPLLIPRGHVHGFTASMSFPPLLFFLYHTS
jgi:quercetin dioxygenase-like cupin family protein